MAIDEQFKPCVMCPLYQWLRNVSLSTEVFAISFAIHKVMGSLFVNEGNVVT